MKKQEIGISTIDYNEDGTVKNALFVPTLKIEQDNNLLKELGVAQSARDITALKQNSELVFASWFRKWDKVISDIELSDREKFEVVSEVVECEKYENGNTKTCSMRFIYREIEAK